MAGKILFLTIVESEINWKSPLVGAWLVFSFNHSDFCCYQGTHDPNYQTLAGVGGDIFGADKKAGGAAPAPPKPPAAGGMAGEIYFLEHSGANISDKV